MRQNRGSRSPTLEVLNDLHEQAQLAAPHELAGLFDSCARRLGAQGAIAYLADLQQHELLALVDPVACADHEPLPAQSVDATLAGRAYQTQDALRQGEDDAASIWWVPLLAGSSRLGVLRVEVGSADVDEAFLARLVRLASAAAGLLAAKDPYGDTLVRLRRRGPLGLAAEMQYAILPPLTFTSRSVSVSAALEPCYEVAGDTIDYAVDDGRTRAAIFDGMGHGMHSAQCAVFTVAAYRNARRRGLTLTQTLQSIDEALTTGLGGEVFTTAVLADLDTRTGLLQWVNAGHPAPLLIRGGKLIRELDTDPQPPIGLGHLLEAQPPAAAKEQLEPKDLVLFYTDGVVEARSPEGDFFGVERLAGLIIRHLAGGLTLPEMMRRVVRELLTHHGEQLTDDATLLMLEWKGSRRTQPAAGLPQFEP